jgi:hypothetical protein
MQRIVVRRQRAHGQPVFVEVIRQRCPCRLVGEELSPVDVVLTGIAAHAEFDAVDAESGEGLQCLRKRFVAEGNGEYAYVHASHPLVAGL